MYKDLRTMVSAFEAAGELVRVREPVSAVLEIAEIADRVSKAGAAGGASASAKRNDPRFHGLGGRAILLERVQGSDMPVLINAFGSYRRMEMALGCAEGQARAGGFDAIAGIIGELVKPQPPRSLGEVLAKAKQFAPLLKIGPKRVRGVGACQAIVETGDAIDLTRLPILRCWPLDGDYASVGYPAGINDGIEGLGHPSIDAAAWEREFRGRYITLAGIHTIHADDRDSAKPASHNIGMYRVQLLGKDRVAMHWHVHHDGAAHWRSWKKLGQPMPVAIALGGPSVLPYGATAPLPPGISELLMAGFLNGRGIRLVRAKTVPLWVPADAEMVIEGWVSHEAGGIGWDPRETDEPLGPGAVFEGPFGDHTGFYSMPDRYPVVRVSAVTRRTDAVYPTTIVGLPPQEDYYLGKATERLFLPLLKVLVPDIEDYDLPMFGAFHNCAFIRIKKHYPMQGRRVMHAIWGAGQMAWTKTIFVVDESVDVHDTTAVLRAAAANCHPVRDVERVLGPLDILDHAAPRLGSGTKIGFDCTPRWIGEDVDGQAITPARAPLGAEARARYLAGVRTIEGVRDAAMPPELGGWLLVSIDKNRPGQGREVLEAVWGVACEGEPPAFVVVVDRDVHVADFDRVLFHWCANSDAGRDAGVDRAGGRLGFDATGKTAADAHAGQAVRAWPPIIAMDDATRELVDAKWSRYFSSTDQ